MVWCDILIGCIVGPIAFILFLVFSLLVIGYILRAGLKMIGNLLSGLVVLFIIGIGVVLVWIGAVGQGHIEILLIIGPAFVPAGIVAGIVAVKLYNEEKREEASKS